MPKEKLGKFKSERARLEFLQMYDRMVEHWPVPSEDLDVDTSFGVTHVRRSGPPGASPIVLVHPNIGTSLAWWRLVGPLAADYEVFAVDTIGALGRSVQTAPIESATDYGSWLGQVIARLGIAPPRVVGYSEGGYVAMCAALGSVPMASLVAIEPGGAIAKVGARFLAAMVVAGIKAQFSDDALRRFAQRISPGVEFAAGEMETVLFGAKNFRQGLPFPKRFTDEQLQNIDVPTLLYMGAKTELYDPVAAADRASRLMADVEALIVPNAQHGLPFQFPELTTETILDFVGRVDGRPRA